MRIVASEREINVIWTKYLLQYPLQNISCPCTTIMISKGPVARSHLMEKLPEDSYFCSLHTTCNRLWWASVSGLKIFILFSVRRYMYEWEVAWPRLWHAKTFNETFVCGTITFGTTTLATVFRKGKRCQIIGFSTFECGCQIDNRIAISGIYSTVLHPSLIGNRCSTGFEEVSFQVMMRLWKGVRSSDDYDCLLHLPRYTCWARNCH